MWNIVFRFLQETRKNLGNTKERTAEANYHPYGPKTLKRRCPGWTCNVAKETHHVLVSGVFLQTHSHQKSFLAFEKLVAEQPTSMSIFKKPNNWSNHSATLRQGMLCKYFCLVEFLIALDQNFIVFCSIFFVVKTGFWRNGLGCENSLFNSGEKKLVKLKTEEFF